MPVALERKLKREYGHRKGWSKARKNRAIYGTLRKTGWRPKRRGRK